MRKHLVLLVRSPSLSYDEEGALAGLRNTGNKVRVVQVRRTEGVPFQREPGDEFYSFHEDLLEGYEGATLLAPEVVHPFGDLLPDGFSVGQRGPYWRLYDKNGNQIGKACYEKEMRSRLEALNGSVVGLESNGSDA